MRIRFNTRTKKFLKSEAAFVLLTKKVESGKTYHIQVVIPQQDGNAPKEKALEDYYVTVGIPDTEKVTEKAEH